MKELMSLLELEYEIIVDTVFQTPGGFSTKAAYRVSGVSGVEYFVKVYDKYLPTTRFYTWRIDSYMPVLEWLSERPSLRGRILTPIKTSRGKFKAETNSDVYVLFLFVHGEMPGIQGMTHAQTAELADILAQLHNASEAVPFESYELIEDISLPFCNQLSQFLDNNDVNRSSIFEIITPHAELLRKAIQKSLHLRDTVRLGYSPLVLCHGDAHGNNVIQGERLVLADWEDLRWAPVEADLFIHAWHPHGNTLLEAYTATRYCYNINHELLYFYILRRRIEDVWVNVQRLSEELPDEAETTKLFNNIKLGIEEIQALL